MNRTPRPGRPAFTLVELLVVIGIIAVLLGILLPALSAAQEQARQIKCASNLRNVGNGIAIYLAENKQIFPPAYLYVGHRIVDGNQTPTQAVQGYIHWSSYIYGEGGAGQGVAAEAFQCPSIENGGLSPTNPPAGQLDDGQTPEFPGVTDEQVGRLAYTVNEAIMPRNKFAKNLGPGRQYRFVNAGMIRDASHTILATEFPQNWKIVSANSSGDADVPICKSHRPVHGFKGLGGALDMQNLQPDPFENRPTYRRLSLDRDDLADDPSPADQKSRLDWVGRNHGRKKGSGFDDRRSNFLYVDGHVETKNIRDTVRPFEWGQRFYSLNPNGDIEP